ncbi:hypothetical protein D3C76_1501140 [compost metagenome]
MREDIFLHPHNEHGGKLQALGAVHGHQHNSIAAARFLVPVHGINIGNEGQIRQEGHQGLVLVPLLKLHGNGEEFIDVFQAGGGFQCILPDQLQLVFGELQGLFRELRYG